MASIQMSGGIREIMSKAERMAAEGRDIIHMEIGRPDFDSPLCAKEETIRSLQAGNVHYTDMAGTYELRKAVADRYRRDNGMDVDADKNIVITCGAMEALTVSMLTMAEAGDEVLVPAPYFPAYADLLAITGAKLKAVPTKMEENYEVTGGALERALTDKTKFILLNTPNNPSGAVLSGERLEEIAEFACKNDLWVISDECYEKFLYEGEHISIASLPGMADRTVTVSSASKTWSMTGWRVGWIVCPENMKPYANKCHQNVSTCANAFAQAGVVEAIACADGDVEKMVSEYKRRRDMVMEHMKRIKGFECNTPSGAFYVFPKVSYPGMDGFELCNRLLDEAGVATVPGEVFGMPGHIRMAYCKSYENVEEGMERIEKAVEKF